MKKNLVMKEVYKPISTAKKEEPKKNKFIQNQGISSKSTDLGKILVNREMLKNVGVVSARESPNRPLPGGIPLKNGTESLGLVKNTILDRNQNNETIRKKGSIKTTGAESRKSDKTASTKKTQLVKSPKSKLDQVDKDHLDLKKRLLKITSGNMIEKEIKIQGKHRKISADNNNSTNTKPTTIKKLSFDLNHKPNLTNPNKNTVSARLHLLAMKCQTKVVPNQPNRIKSRNGGVPVVFFENIIRLKEVMTRL